VEYILGREQILFWTGFSKDVLNFHNLSLAGYCEEDRLSLYMDGGTGPGREILTSHDWIWGPLDLFKKINLFGHFIDNAAEDSCRAGKDMISREDLFGEYYDWVFGGKDSDSDMECRPTHTLSLFLSVSFLLYLWRTRWVLPPLFLSLFSSFSFSWYLLIKIKFLDISWWKTLFLFIFEKACI